MRYNTRSIDRPFGLVKTMHALKIAALLGLLASTACGFQLRGGGTATVQAIEAPVHIASDAFSEVAQELRRTLQDSDVALAEIIENAALLVVVEREQTDSRTLSISSSNETRDIELSYSVRVGVYRPDALEKVSEQITVRREFEFVTSGVLGSSDEEDRLYDEMRRELVRNILGRLQLASNKDED